MIAEEFTFIDNYLRSIGKTPLLEQSQELELLHKAQDGDVKARDTIVKHNLKLVVDIAKKYTKRGLPFMDLVQEGNMGLVHAIDKFNFNFKCRFSTYATGWIKCYMLRGLSDTSHLIRLPRSVIDEIKAYRKAWDILTEKLSKEPTELQICEQMDCTIKKLQRVKEAMLNESMISLDTLVCEDTSLADFISVEDETQHTSFVSNNVSNSIQSALNLLSVVERTALIHRYGLFNNQPRTYVELSRILCMSDESARRVVKRAITKLRAEKRIGRLRGLY